MKESRFKRQIANAKRKARPELRSHEWDQLNYSKKLLFSKELLDDDNIERVDGRKLSVDQFVKLFETRRIPIILTGLTENWRATRKWSLDELSRKYRNQKFKCGEDDDGYSVKLKMKYFVEYMRVTNDDCPLYIFDSSFGERHKTRRLMDDYEVPVMFRDDLFRYANEKRRPPYRWIVIGPARSGTGIHIDPLGTSAWNALIYGHKKWCFLHPESPKELVKPFKEECGKHPDEATTWFSSVYGRMKAAKLSRELASIETVQRPGEIEDITSLRGCPSPKELVKPFKEECGKHPDEATTWMSSVYGRMKAAKLSRELASIETVQRPGEVIFVPSGWWHVVLNLDDTVAITQNYCSVTNLPTVWRKTIKKRPNFAKHWLRALRCHRPEILPIIEQAAKEGSDLDFASSDDSSSSSSSSSSYSSDSGRSFKGSDYGGGDTLTFSRKRKHRSETSNRNECDNGHSAYARDECVAKAKRYHVLSERINATSASEDVKRILISILDQQQWKNLTADEYGEIASNVEKSYPENVRVEADDVWNSINPTNLN
ncbi:Bifunctional arginine demethylase and lysyl-hydroxylase psr-1 [Toxocara canis]|uniref:Bifunctional arginine demethylase and lysyl-hydroxylase psr-1 n=1 Tax=Toxocara canis TaxID=6265 RepID=A0A0B2VGI2_TOXCA|nr:Bifunctional arginine demethylase and lysyl-hydroxylase psr-1 [Toxocara canis]